MQINNVSKYRRICTCEPVCADVSPVGGLWAELNGGYKGALRVRLIIELVAIKHEINFRSPIHKIWSQGWARIYMELFANRNWNGFLALKVQISWKVLMVVFKII